MKYFKTIGITILIFSAFTGMAQKKGTPTSDDPCPVPKFKKGQTSAEVNRETMEYVMCQRLKKERKDKEKIELNKQREIENEQKKQERLASEQQRREEQRLERERNTNSPRQPSSQRHDPQKEAAQRAREERQRLIRERANEERRKKRAAEGG